MAKYLVLSHSMAQAEDWRKVQRLPLADVFHGVNVTAVERAPRDVQIVYLDTWPLVAPERREAIEAVIKARWPAHAAIRSSLKFVQIVARARAMATPEQLAVLREGWKSTYGERARESDEGLHEAIEWTKSVVPGCG